MRIEDVTRHVLRGGVARSVVGHSGPLQEVLPGRFGVVITHHNAFDDAVRTLYCAVALRVISAREREVDAIFGECLDESVGEFGAGDYGIISRDDRQINGMWCFNNTVYIKNAVIQLIQIII